MWGFTISFALPAHPHLTSGKAEYFIKHFLSLRGTKLYLNILLKTLFSRVEALRNSSIAFFDDVAQLIYRTADIFILVAQLLNALFGVEDGCVVASESVTDLVG